MMLSSQFFSSAENTHDTELASMQWITHNAACAHFLHDPGDAWHKYMMNYHFCLHLKDLCKDKLVAEFGPKLP